MAERRMGMIAFLFCLCLCLLTCCAQAASTADAVEMIAPDQPCSLTLSYRSNGTAFEGVQVKLYQIADVSADFQYSLTDDFAASGLVLNGIRSAGEWNVIRSSLEAYILGSGIKETLVDAADDDGNACYIGLKPGLYLAEAVETESCTFGAALVALPGLGVDGRWQYQVTVAPKVEQIPPIEADEEVEYKVLKLWKGDEGRSDRPQSVKLEIFKDGKSQKIVSLSAKNNWCYKWVAKKDGASWKVVERDVPSGYVATVEKRDTSFTLTNTRPKDTPPKDEVEPVESPQTGDSRSILIYTALMYGSGILLVLFGFTGKRKRK